MGKVLNDFYAGIGFLLITAGLIFIVISFLALDHVSQELKWSSIGIFIVFLGVLLVRKSQYSAKKIINSIIDGIINVLAGI